MDSKNVVSSQPIFGGEAGKLFPIIAKDATAAIMNSQKFARRKPHHAVGVSMNIQNRIIS